jgi:cell division protein FtsZ
MEGKIRVLAIMTGVKSAQILGTRQSYKTMIEDMDNKRSNPKSVEMPQTKRSSRDQPSGGGVLEWVG